MNTDTINPSEPNDARTEAAAFVQHLTQAFEHSAIGVTLQDFDLNIIEANPAFCDLLGYSRPELIEQNTIQLTLEADQERSRQQLKRLKRGDIHGFQIDKRYVHAEDHVIWARVSVSVIENPYGEPNLVLTQVQNITAQRQIKQDLADNEAQLEAIIRSMGEGVMVFDPDGQLIVSNDRITEMFGFEPGTMDDASQLFGGKWKAFREDGTILPLDEYPAAITLQTGEPQREFICFMQKPNGNRVWLEVNTEPVHLGAHGDMVAVVLSMTDITEKRRTQQALEDREEQLSMALDGAQLGTWDWHLGRRELVLNETSSDILGYCATNGRYLLDDVRSHFHPEDVEHIEASMNKHLHGQQSHFNVDARLRNMQNDYVWLNLRGRITERDKQDKPVRVSGMLVDISERKKLEGKLVDLATKDSLTNIYNRGYGSTTLEREMAQARRQEQPLSLMLIDIDHFKRINDDFGHDHGDKVLIEIAEILTDNVRESDLAARWGGEEFAVILPNTPLDAAQAKAEQLLEQVRKQQLPDGRNLTMSVGVTQYRDEESGTEFLKRADLLMYEAKNAGRDRVRAGE